MKNNIKVDGSGTGQHTQTLNTFPVCLVMFFKMSELPFLIPSIHVCLPDVRSTFISRYIVTVSFRAIVWCNTIYINCFQQGVLFTKYYRVDEPVPWQANRFVAVVCTVESTMTACPRDWQFGNQSQHFTIQSLPPSLSFSYIHTQILF